MIASRAYFAHQAAAVIQQGRHARRHLDFRHNSVGEVVARRGGMQLPASRRAPETLVLVCCGRRNSTVDQMLTISMRKLWIQQPQQSFAGAASATHAHNQRRNKTKREAKRHRCNLNKGEEHRGMVDLHYRLETTQLLSTMSPMYRY